MSAVVNPKLTIAYSVLSEGVQNLILPPPREDTEIVVIVQGLPISIPHRRDIRVISLNSVGVTKSRNEAIRQAKGEVLVFGEEQVEWIHDNLDEAIAVFERNPGLAIFLGRAEDQLGNYRKRYGSMHRVSSIWNSAHVGTIELAVRPKMLLQSKVAFDEEFGAGTDNYLGDEYILVSDALRAGLSCEYFPITISRHPAESSGTRFGSSRDARARARVYKRVFGLLAPFVRFIVWARNPKRFGINGLRFISNRRW